MKLSVVTCTWNSEPHIAQSIASVLAQDYPKIEYIFVDGGSTDGTLERIESLVTSHTLVRNVRGGVSHAMNEGIRVATGDVVAHLHSDDYYLHRDTLSRVMRGFHQDGVDWVMGRIAIDKDGHQTIPRRSSSPYSFGNVLSGSFSIFHPATFVRRRIFDEVGMFDESLKYAMDWDLWLRIAKNHTPAIVNSELTAFRIHDGSLSSATAHSKLKARKEELRVRMRYAHLAPLHAAIYVARYLVRAYRLSKEAEVLSERLS